MGPDQLSRLTEPNDDQGKPAGTADGGSRLERLTGLAGHRVLRPVRFGLVGALTFGLQLMLLTMFTEAAVSAVPAYIAALAIAVQFNFVVNQTLVWHDRSDALNPRRLAERWLTFHAFIALSLVLNVIGFAVAEPFMPLFAAALVGLAVSTVVKYVSLDRLVFRTSRHAAGQDDR